MSGPTLFDDPDDTPWGDRSKTIQQAFEEFHHANPWVYDRLVHLADELHKRGQRRIGIGMLFEVLRYQFLATADPNSSFKLNNNYRSRYARMIVARNPHLEGSFETRELKAS